MSKTLNFRHDEAHKPAHATGKGTDTGVPAEPPLTRPSPLRQVKPVLVASAPQAPKPERVAVSVTGSRRRQRSGWTDIALLGFVAGASVLALEPSLLGYPSAAFDRLTRPSDAATVVQTAAPSEPDNIRAIVDTSMDAEVMTTLDFEMSAPMTDSADTLPLHVPTPPKDNGAAVQIAPDVQDASPVFTVAVYDASGLEQLTFPSHDRTTISDKAPEQLVRTTLVRSASQSGGDPLRAPTALTGTTPLDTHLPWIVARVIGAPPVSLPVPQPVKIALASPGLDAPDATSVDLSAILQAARNPEKPTGPNLSGLEVRVHGPGGVRKEDLALMALDLSGTGAVMVDPIPSGYSVSDAHVRYYHGSDAVHAGLLAKHLGLGLRGFTDLASKPRAGLVEIWLSGTAPRPVRTTRRVAPQVQPAASPETAATTPQRIVDPNLDLDRNERPWWQLGFLRGNNASSGGGGGGSGGGSSAGDGGGTTSGGNGNGGGGGNGGGNAGGNGNGNRGGNGNGNGSRP